MRSSLSQIPAAAMALSLALAASEPMHAAAQVTREKPHPGQTGAARSAPTRAHFPDLLGIYMGMPAGEARAQLQKHSSDASVQYASNANEGFGLSTPGMPLDQISVSITQPPNVPTVWKIQRDQSFGDALSRNALVDALHKKYGKETFSRAPVPGSLQLYWIFDSNGQLLPSADPGLMACNAVVPGAMIAEIASRCAQNFFALYMSISSQGPDGDSVQSYTMVLIDYPSATRAAKLTADAKKAAADRAQRDEDRKRAGQPTPDF